MDPGFGRLAAHMLDDQMNTPHQGNQAAQGGSQGDPEKSAKDGFLFLDGNDK